MTSKWQEAKNKFGTAEQAGQILILDERISKIEKVLNEMLKPNKMTVEERLAKAREAKKLKKDANG